MTFQVHFIQHFIYELSMQILECFRTPFSYTKLSDYSFTRNNKPLWDTLFFFFFFRSISAFFPIPVLLCLLSMCVLCFTGFTYKEHKESIFQIPVCWMGSLHLYRIKHFHLEICYMFSFIEIFFPDPRQNFIDTAPNLNPT